MNDFENLHPREANGTFAEKPQSAAEVQLPRAPRFTYGSQKRKKLPWGSLREGMVIRSTFGDALEVRTIQWRERRGPEVQTYREDGYLGPTLVLHPDHDVTVLHDPADEPVERSAAR